LSAADKGVPSDAAAQTFCCRTFFENYDVSTWTRDEAVLTFSKQGSQFCADVFYGPGWPLSTVNT